MMIDVGPLPEGYVVVDCIVLMKVLNQDGGLVFREHFGSGLSVMEKYGMTLSAADTCKNGILKSARPEET